MNYLFYLHVATRERDLQDETKTIPEGLKVSQRHGMEANVALQKISKWSPTSSSTRQRHEMGQKSWRLHFLPVAVCVLSAARVGDSKCLVVAACIAPGLTCAIFGCRTTPSNVSFGQRYCEEPSGFWSASPQVPPTGTAAVAVATVVMVVAVVVALVVVVAVAVAVAAPVMVVVIVTAVVVVVGERERERERET